MEEKKILLYKKRIIDLEDEVEALRNLVKKQGEILENLKEEINKLKGEKKNSSKNIKAKEQDEEDSSLAKLSFDNEQILNLKKELNKQKEKNEELEKKLNDKNDIQKAYAKQNDELEKVKDELKSKNEELRKITDLLEDKEREVKRARENLEDKESKLKKLETELEEKSDQFRRAKVDLEDKESENRKLKKDNLEFEITLEKNKKIIEKYKKLNEAYEIYNELSEDSKKRLNLIKDDDELNFLVSCINKEKIENLHNYISTEIANNEMKDVKNLKLVFDYFFDIYSNINNNRFERSKVRIGDTYDSQACAKCKGRATGKIEEVLFLGFNDVIQDKVIRKSVVNVNE